MNFHSLSALIPSKVLLAGLGVVVVTGTATAVAYYRQNKRVEAQQLSVAVASPTPIATPTPMVTPSVTPTTTPAPSSAATPATATPAKALSEKCSPRGTATCDGQGNPISPGGNAGGEGTVGIADGVKKLTDIGFKQVALSSAGLNGLDVDPDTGLVYVVSNATVGNWCGKTISNKKNQLSVVDPSQEKELAAVATEPGPVWPLVSKSNNSVYVAASAEGYVVQHELGTGNKLASIKVGGLPHDLGLDSESGILLVSNTNDGSQKYAATVQISDNAILGQHAVAALPHRIALDSAKRLAYMVSVGSGTISVFNMADGTPAGSFETGGQGTMAFSPATRRMFVPNKNEAGKPETIRVINVDTKELVGTIGPFLTNAGHQAFGMIVDDANGFLYVSIGDSSLVGIADINTLKPLAVFEANDCTWGVRIDSKRGRGFVTGVTTGTLGVFDLAKVKAAVQ